jgi:hypothetical protein
MEAEMALAGVSDRGSMASLRPLLAVFCCGVRLVSLRRGLPADKLSLQIGCLRRVPFPEIRGASRVRTGHKTVTAANTAGVVHDYHPLFILVSCCDGTDFYTRWVLALNTRTGNKALPDVGVLAHLLLDDGAIYHTRRELVLRHATYSAGRAPNAAGDVDDHTPPDIARLFHQGTLEIPLHPNQVIFNG